MSDEVQVADPALPTVIPWYKSGILRAVLVIVCAQALKKFAAQYHIDFEVVGITADSLAGFMMDIISAGALGFIGHARVSKTVPPLVSSKAKADAINTAIKKSYESPVDQAVAAAQPVPPTNS